MRNSKSLPKCDKDEKSQNRSAKRTNRGSKPKYKGKVDESKPKEISSDVNDPSYYYEDGNMLQQVTNYTFNQFLGVPLKLETLAQMSYNVANIMTVWLNPAVQPTTDDIYSSMYGINIAATKNYLYLSANNAKTTNYGPQDPMALLLGVRSVVELYGFIKRAFGVAYLYNTRNREYPSRLLANMHIDADDLRKNLASYRIRMNTDIALFDRIPFPKNIPILDKADKMYSGIYLDEASPMAQTYMFCPYSVWQINEAYNPQGIGLDTVVVYSNNIEQMDYYLSIFETLLASLANSSLLNYVYSDILRVCGDNNLFKLELIPENYGVLPAVNNETRIWLHNMMTVGAPIALDDMPTGMTTGMTGLNDVETNTNGDGLNYHPMFRLNNYDSDNASYLPFVDAVIDFETINPTIDEKVAATRLAARMDTVGVTTTGFVGVYSTGLPVLGDYYVVRVGIDDGSANETGLSSVYPYYDTLNATALRTINTRMCKLSQFNFGPLAYMTGKTNDSEGSRLYNIHGDINFFTTLNLDYMRQMRDAEMIAEFGFRF